MRRLAASVFAAFMLFMLSPCAFASELLTRPEEGQFVLVDADNHVDYRADFPLSALKSASRSGDDLLIELSAGRLLLCGFFKPMGEWRSVAFSDGKSLSGGDFDVDGLFLGSFSTVESLEKHSSSPIRAASPLLTVEYSQYGIGVYDEGQAVYGELRDVCIEHVNKIYPPGKPDWQKLVKLYFEFVQETDGNLRPSRAKFAFTNGISVSAINPAAVCISDSLSLLPLSVGRSYISYENALGDELFSLNVRCGADEKGELYLSSSCSACGETQGELLHYLPCGHYSCAQEHNPEVHGEAACGYAGHCLSEGDHSKCKNCLEALCNGQSHGYGQCQHMHNWVPVSVYTSRCIVCNYEYTSPAKPAG